MASGSAGRRPSSEYGAAVRVVVVDNDTGALDLLELDLRLEGHDIVATALDGPEGIEACRRTRPDVLIVDYRMPPGIDGVEVARAVLRDGSAGSVPTTSPRVRCGRCGQRSTRCSAPQREPRNRTEVGRST